ncbi:MAG: hypothetical protein O2860_05420 [Chloroflexi bacterium]|nr:hypothetical protein [Chloroflexota bacterium]
MVKTCGTCYINFQCNLSCRRLYWGWGDHTDRHHGGSNVNADDRHHGGSNAEADDRHHAGSNTKSVGYP